MQSQIPTTPALEDLLPRYHEVVKQKIDTKILTFLIRYKSLKLALKHILYELISEQCPCTEYDSNKALKKFLSEKNLTTDEQLGDFLRQNLLTKAALMRQLSQGVSLSIFAQANFSSKVESSFLQKKASLDRVIYSLLRVENYNMARELYLRISESECDFAELAQIYARGPEAATRGIVGPVPLAQAHPVLAKKLKSAQPGELIEPFSIEQWWLVVRLESIRLAKLDAETSQRLVQDMLEQELEKCIISAINILQPLVV